MKNEKTSNSEMLKQFVIIFLLVTLAQVMFGIFFPSKPNTSPEVTQRAEYLDMPPITVLEEIRYHEVEMPCHTLRFDEKTGDLTEIFVKGHWENKDHEDQVRTLFVRSESEKQVMHDAVIKFNKSQSVFEKSTPKAVIIQNDATTSRVEVIKDFGSFMLTVTYMPQPNSSDSSPGFGLIKKSTLSLKASDTTSDNEPVDNYEFYLYTELRNTGAALIEGTQQGMRMFQGASFHTDKIKYKKLPFTQFEKKNINEAVSSGWFAFSQRYFATAVKFEEPGTLYTNYVSNDKTYVIGYL
ncbi:MAG: hypothetical protein FJ161_00830, partial [Gammaproteobacteria bacterium]|nr:hypothetical protein [Gammaproteobacteria bacterium]